MDALRNHVQHRNLPIASLSYPSKWIDAPDTGFLRFSLKPLLDVHALQEDEKFKKSVLKELEANEDNCNVTLLVRQFMASLSRVHLSVRQATSEILGKSRTMLAETLELGAHQNGLAAIKAHDTGHYSDPVYISGDVLQRLDKKRKQHTLLVHLSKWYVSGRLE